MPDAYLDVDSIRDAADLVNSTLLAKGYVQEKLLFNTIDFEAIAGPDASLAVSEAVYNNDKNTINIIYSLLEAVDRNKSQNQQFNRVVAQKDAAIEDLHRKVASLETRLAAADAKINRSIQVDHIQLQQRVQLLTNTNRTQAHDLNKLKTWASAIKTKHQVELKKKNVEISSLKDKLLDDRNLLNIVVYGRPVLLEASRPRTDDAHTNAIHNNNPTVDNAISDASLAKIRPIVAKEHEEIATQLTELVENQVQENSQFSLFLSTVNKYFSSLNAQLSNLNHRALTVEALPNPSDEINLQDIINRPANMDGEFKSFAYIAHPFLNNVYKNYHYISNLVGFLETSSGVQADLTETKSLEKLRKENDVLYQNWQDAVKALDDWKLYLKR